ncbi:hypothetical protein CK203_057615 [Vitis vinifera]|uniref:Uncharacterized protein n=1 Tax=Vitis vinifera TaxID=29760 RepID=A0A438GNJ6_VITVI|nr:hypothetical protein CK203_057615 [Vitis vinifera]
MPVVTTDPLPIHDTRVVPPPPGGVHLIGFSGDEIFIMGWDGKAPQPISLYENSDFSGYIHGHGKVAQPPLVDRPFVGTDAREDFRDRMMRYCASCAPHRLAYPFGASWPHPAHIEMP